MISIAELRTIPLLASLPDTEATALAARMADVRLRTGDWLIHEGEQPSFFMLVAGSLEMRKMVHGSERRINTVHIGDYFGELPLLLGAPAMASVRALEPSRVAQLDHNDFNDLYSACKKFSEALTQTMTQRFSYLRTLAEALPPPRVTIVGHSYDIACHHLRDFLARNRITFRWVDPTRPLPSAEVETPRAGDRYPVIKAHRSRLAGVVARVPELMEKVDLALESTNKLLGDQNRAAFSESLENIRKFTAGLAERNQDIAELTENAKKAAATLSSLLDSVDQSYTGPDGIGNQAKLAVADFDRLAKNLSDTNKQLQLTLQDVRPGVRSFSQQTLSDVGALVGEARQLISGVSRLVAEIERDPSRVLLGDRREGYRPK